ncbi:MAG: MAPEG family protein [Proteobacteria bacterium]|nr:MAPEG family protein [Pseudomonadota bacterium]
MTKGPLTAGEYRDLREQSDFPAWVRRANRAHINFVEQYGAFAGLVIVAHLTGAANETTALAAMAFFWFRIAHSVVMLAGIRVLMLRTLIFTCAFLSLLVIAWQIAF